MFKSADAESILNLTFVGSGGIYEGKDGKKHRPLMIHRVIYGSLERFMAILIEHYAGCFPLWLSPSQIKIVTVNDNCIDYAKKIEAQLKSVKISVELYARSESVGKKIRDAEAEKTPIIITIGEKEVEKNKLAVREQGKVRFDINPDALLKEIKERIEKRC